MVIKSHQEQSVSPTLDALELSRESSYACLLDFLFRPHADVLHFVTEYTSLFSLPTVFSVGIQIRVGDEAMQV